MIKRTLAFVILFSAAAHAQLPEVVTRPRLERNGGVDFHALVSPETVYVGQQATYQLGVFIDQETRGRLRRNPEFIPPESRAMLSYDLPDPGGSLSVNRDGRSYEVHVFRRALFPLTPGHYTINPARLAYTLPQGQSFFSREESFSLRSEQVSLVAIDPPLAGRPASWAGAVGSWRASARVDTSRDRAGDPLVLTLRIEGTGNVALLPRPVLTIPWATVVAANERVKIDSTPSALRGSKEFDWLVTPRVSGAQRVPAIRFSYFNPFARRYEDATSEAFAVQVAPGTIVVADSATAPPPPEKPFTLRQQMGDEAPLPLGDLAVIRWFLLLAPLPALFAWIAKRPRRVRAPRTAAERLRAMATPAGAAAAPAEVRSALLDAVRRRTGLDAASLTDPGAWARALRFEGVTDATAAEAERFLDALDAAAFGGAAAGTAELAKRATALLAKIDTEARKVRTARRAPQMAATAGAIALVFTLATAAALLARDIERAREPFARGLVAYAGADYMRAARLFEDAARAAPRTPAIWANAGTAAWAANDTAGAVVGWQHALRLDPLADDLRDRLARVRAPQDIGVARVPLIPPRAPSAVAVLLWIVGWVVVTRLLWRRRHSAAMRFALATLIIAGGAATAARLFEDRIEGRDLAVVTDPGPLRALPALGADAGAVPLVGEVAHIVQRQGVWTHIELDGERDGWIASERLMPLRLGNN
ncbi:MAG TPA: BatD family protein [Gemmatimonadaceae bacterium]|nr:BatD family protein [Gemmatimonadaceae bacterium]